MVAQLLWYADSVPAIANPLDPPLQVTEQMLKAFDVEMCGDLIAKRALLSALFSKVRLVARTLARKVPVVAGILSPHDGSTTIWQDSCHYSRPPGRRI